MIVDQTDFNEKSIRKMTFKQFKAKFEVVQPYYFLDEINKEKKLKEAYIKLGGKE